MPRQSLRPEDLKSDRLLLPAIVLSVAAVLFAFSAASAFYIRGVELVTSVVLIGAAAGLLGAMYFHLRNQHDLRLHRIFSAISAAEAARAQAELAAREKSQMLATMSHEIRTPLNAITGVLSLLSDSGLTPHQRNFVDTAHASGRTLLSIIDEILDTAGTGARGKPAAIDVVTLIESVTELLAPRAHAKGLEISAHIEGDVPREIVAEEVPMRQILFNLAGNAIKFTENGGVAVDVACDDKGLVIKVRDTGIGMSRGEAARVFDDFVQANTTTRKRFGGTGLGLSISRRLAVGMGGTIAVESRPKKGTAFTVSLPLSAKGEPVLEGKPLANRHYVLALPKGFTRDHLRRALREMGAEVTVVENGKVLAAQLRNAKPLHQFICGSKYFPQLRRWAGTLGRSKAQPALVWVMMQAEERKNNMDLLRAPFAGYLLKPLRRSTLLTQLSSADGRSLKRASRLLRNLKKAEPRGTPQIPRLSILLAEDNSVNALLSRTILERMGHHVTLVGDGDEVLKVLKGDKTFDIALLDVEMPMMSGLEVTRIVRSEPAFRHRATLPIMALTANARPQDLRDCRAAGMDEHLAKPFDRMDLEEKIANMVRHRRRAA